MLKFYKGGTLILLGLFLNGCKLLTFTAQPGSPRNAYPPEMQGTYRAVDHHKSGNDTTVFKISETSVTSNDLFLGKILNLTDTTSLSHLGDFYFFNIMQSDSGKNRWWTFPILVKKDALYIFSLSQGKQEKKLARYLKPTGKVNGEYRMDNEPFKNYCERYLKKRKAYQLKRIK